MRPRPLSQAAGFVLLLAALTAVAVSLIELVSAGELVALYLYIVGVAVVLAVIALRILAAAARIHPNIRKYSVISLDIASITRSVNAGEPFALRLGGALVNVRVEPEPLNGGGAEIIEIAPEGEITRRPLKTDITYAGWVEGARENSTVRMTITESMLTGYVLQGRDWWFVEPLRLFRIDASTSDYLVYRTKDLRFKMDVGNDIVPRMVEQFSPGGLPEGSGYLDVTPQPTGPPQPHKVGPSIGIAIVADDEYALQAKWTGALWYEHQIGVLNNVNGLYKNNLACSFYPKCFLLSHKGLDHCAADKLLADMESVVVPALGDLRRVDVRASSGIEVAHLTSGKNLDGKTLGIAWQPGVYSLSQQQLVWIGGGGGFGGPPNLGFQNMMLMAHEVGHNFNGEHNEADEWCVAHFLFCWDYERSLMWPTFYDDNNPWISDGSRDANHNNRARMNKNMAQQRNYHM